MFDRLKKVISTIKIAGLRKHVGKAVESVLAKVPIITRKGTRPHKSHYGSSEPLGTGNFDEVISDVKDIGHRKHLENFVKILVARVPIIDWMELKRTRPHKSHKDPSNPLTAVFYTSNKRNEQSKQNKGESRSRVASAHVFSDGTWKIKFKRGGNKKYEKEMEKERERRISKRNGE